MRLNPERSEEQLFFEALLTVTERYLRQLGFVRVIPLQDSDRPFRLEPVTTYIPISGALNGLFIFSVEERLARAFAVKYLIDEVTEDEAAGYAVDAVAEISNVISGGALCGQEGRITLGYPHLCNEEIELDDELCGTQPMIRQFQTEYGNFECIYVRASGKAGMPGRSAQSNDNGWEEYHG